MSWSAVPAGTCPPVAKANNLDPFGYLLFLLQELPRLGEKPDDEQLRDYLPWSTTIPAYCRKK